MHACMHACIHACMQARVRAGIHARAIFTVLCATPFGFKIRSFPKPLTITPPHFSQCIDAKSASNESITLKNRWNSGESLPGGAFINLRIGGVLLIRGDPNLKIHGQSSGLDFG